MYVYRNIPFFVGTCQRLSPTHPPCTRFPCSPAWGRRHAAPRSRSPSGHGRTYAPGSRAAGKGSGIQRQPHKIIAGQFGRLLVLLHTVRELGWGTRAAAGARLPVLRWKNTERCILLNWYKTIPNYSQCDHICKQNLIVHTDMSVGLVSNLSKKCHASYYKYFEIHEDD